MKSQDIAIELKASIISRFSNVENDLSGSALPFVKNKRKNAIEYFAQLGFPNTQSESWRKTDLSSALERPYNWYLEKPSTQTNLNDVFKCDVNDFDTDIYAQLNGWFIDQKEELTKMPDGTIVGSLSAAMTAYPNLVEKHFGAYASDETNGLIALNSAIFTDGLFVYVPKNVETKRTLQLVNIISLNENIFANTRNLIILEANSKLQIIHCDDSIDFKHSFINTVTEVFIGDGAQLDYYKLQNKDSDSVVLTNTYVHQEANSSLHSNTISLNGGLIRNGINVTLNKPGAQADVSGIYLVDKKQFIDNHIFIDHKAPNCTSNQLFKGIADDSAKAVFNGHILVERDAQQTVAYQNNNNIQLTETSKIDTHPFLEIYADDVKCSHGATVGQLDSNALFYLMQRGICYRNARMLLMVAFADEVVNKIKIDVLRNRIYDLIRRRLKGELHACDQCSIQCVNPDSPMQFDIDLSKI